MSLGKYSRRLSLRAWRKERLRREFKQQGLRRVTLDGLSLVEAGLRPRAYQPLYGLENDPKAPEWGITRNTEERWAMIEPHLPKSGSALDVGSQHGWFTFKLAEHGLFAIGVERAETSLRVSKLLALDNGAGRVGFMRATFSPETAVLFPTADVVLCMSVFHHLVRRDGLPHAEAAMKQLSARCRKQLFFETGQSDDTNHKWARDLDFMGDSPKQWINDFLLSLGFSQVTHVGDTLGHKHESPRHLMLATK